MQTLSLWSLKSHTYYPASHFPITQPYPTVGRQLSMKLASPPPVFRYWSSVIEFAGSLSHPPPPFPLFSLVLWFIIHNLCFCRWWYSIICCKLKLILCAFSVSSHLISNTEDLCGSAMIDSRYKNNFFIISVITELTYISISSIITFNSILNISVSFPIMENVINVQLFIPLKPRPIQARPFEISILYSSIYLPMIMYIILHYSMTTGIYNFFVLVMQFSYPMKV